MPTTTGEQAKLRKENEELRTQIEEQERARERERLEQVLSSLTDGQERMHSSLVDFRGEVTEKLDGLDGRIGTLEGQESERGIREEERAKIAEEAAKNGSPTGAFDPQKMLLSSAGGGGLIGVVLFVLWMIAKSRGWL